MVSAKTRTTRSRYSSPAQHNGTLDRSGPLGTAESSTTNEGSRSVMDRWLEPSIQNKTSFEQAGLVRYGVLEHMAPLGSMPKSKKSAAADKENGNASAVRRIILRPSAKGTRNSARDSSPAPKTPAVTDAAATPATAPAGGAGGAASPTADPAAPSTSPRQSSSGHQRRRSAGAREAAEDDDDYEPGKSLRLKPMGRPSLPKRGRPPSSVRRSSMVSSVKSTPAKTRHATPPPPPQRRPSHGPEFVEKVIETAVDEAIAHHRYPTAWALRCLYDEKSDDTAFVSMVAQVFNQTADARTMKEFSALVEKRKREGSRDNMGRDYFIPPADDGHVTPHHPRPAPYARLILRSGRSDKNDESETRATKKIKIHHRSGSGAHDSTTTPRKPSTAAKDRKTRGSAAHAKTPVSSRKRVRRGSASSDSTLSSVDNLSSPDLPDGSDLNADAGPASPSLRRGDKVKARARAASARASGRAKTGAASDGAPQQPPSQAGAGPITIRRKSPGSTKQQRQHHQRQSEEQQSSSRTSEAATPRIILRSPITKTRHHHSRTNSAGDDASMPGKLASSEAPPDPFFTEDQPAAWPADGPLPSARRNSRSWAATDSSTPFDLNDSGGQDDSWGRRREAQKVTNGYTAAESSIRHGETASQTTPVRSTRRTRQSNALLSTGPRATRSASKRANDDIDRLASPGAFSVSAQGDRSSVMGSRAATPTASMRPAKKQKTGLRVKSSPVKKKGGTAAGVPRSAGEAQSSVSNGASKDQTYDNDEYCSACGNAGDVVCCDGCPRSFHFECVGMDPSEDLPGEWYCNECFVKQYPSRVPIHKGLFGGPLNVLEKSIHRAFSLPKKLQTRFEGVKVGPDGDYEEVTTGRSTRRKNHGYEESMDFFKQREDGEAVLCHDCQKPASDSRAIIPCSVCPLHWHIDCLDPPLAVPPVLKTWKCPAHVDDMLQEAPPLAPAHRYRRIKGARAITPALGRGLKNNGHIEIDWGSEPEDEDHSGWRDVASFGRTYKVPAEGVRLDFIEQLRNQGAGYAPRKNQTGRGEPYLTPPVEDMAHLHHSSAAASDRNVEEMQASLVLASLQSAPTNGLEQLTSALLSSAAPAVISLIAQGDADSISRRQLADHDKVSLRALLVQMDTMADTIRGLLGNDNLGSRRAPSTIADSKASVDKVDSEALVTEPTPPSTIDHEGAMDFD